MGEIEFHSQDIGKRKPPNFFVRVKSSPPPIFRGKNKFITFGILIVALVALVVVMIVIVPLLSDRTEETDETAGETLEERVLVADRTGETDEVIAELDAKIAVADQDDKLELYRLYSMKYSVQANSGRYSDAISTLNEQAKIAPDDKLFSVYVSMASVYGKIDGDFRAEQIEYLKKALALDLPDPNEDRIYYAAKLCDLSGEMCEEEQSDE
jgi:tetratricopeptide (TPR) repeat protein